MNNTEIVNGENPSVIWSQLMDYLSKKGEQMKSEYTKRMRENKPFTWNCLDVLNKEIHEQLDYIITGNEENQA